MNRTLKNVVFSLSRIWGSGIEGSQPQKTHARRLPFRPIIEQLEKRELLNSAPVGAPDPYNVVHDNTLTKEAPGVLSNDTDEDPGDQLTAVYVPGSGPANGELTYFNEDGSFSYQPDSGYIGGDSFRYRAFDGTDYSSEITVTIQVTNPYANYLAAVAGANTTFTDAVDEAFDDYQDTFDEAVDAAEDDASNAYVAYQSELSGAYGTYLSLEGSAFGDYSDAVDAADVTINNDVSQAETTYNGDVANAENTFYATMSEADDTYTDAIADADQAYDEYVDPYQIARDEAYSYYQANPGDPEAQAAYEQAQADLDNAIEVASDELDDAYGEAADEVQTAKDDAVQAELSDSNSAVVNYMSALSAAEQAWNSAEQGARSTYSSEEANAWGSFIGEEDTAWGSYTDNVGLFQSDLDNAVTEAQGAFYSAISTPTSNWQTTEGDAWAAYLNDLGGAAPEARITDAPPLPNLDPAPVLPVEGRDPGGLLVAGKIVLDARTLTVAGLVATAITGAAVAVFYLGSSGAVDTSVRLAVLAEMATNGNRRSAGFEYTGTVLTLASEGGVGDLLARGNQLKASFETQGFTGVNVQAKAFIRYSVAQPDRNPRSGNAPYTVSFRFVVTATPPGAAAPITTTAPAGSFVGEFNAVQLTTATLAP